MRPEFITVGTVVNAHGVRGEVKVNPAGFDPAFIAAFRTLYIGGVETKVAAARVHKSTVLLTLPGVDTMDGALALKEAVKAHLTARGMECVDFGAPTPACPPESSLTRSWRAAPWWTTPPARSSGGWTRYCPTPPTRSIRCGAALTST